LRNSEPVQLEKSQMDFRSSAFGRAAMAGRLPRSRVQRPDNAVRTAATIARAQGPRPSVAADQWLACRDQ
jgi:hypothetical protein